MAKETKQFTLQLNDGRLIETAGELQIFVGELHDKLPSINTPDNGEAKARYNKFAKYYNENVNDIWTIYK